LQHIF